MFYWTGNKMDRLVEKRVL